MCENKLLMDSLFSILKNLFSENEIVYMSTPINTGKRFIEWYSLIGKDFTNNDKFNEEKFKNVIKPNTQNAKYNAKKIREKTNKIVINPTNFENEMLGWSQDEFYEFWDRVIKTLVNYVIFIDGWEFSIGCCFEVLSAIESGIEIYSQNEKALTIEDVIDKLNDSINIYKTSNLNDWKRINNVLEKVKKYKDSKYKNSKCYKLIKKYDGNMKDEKLDYLVTNKIANVAQFISFEPDSDVKTRFIHINNFDNNKEISIKKLIEKLILSAPSKSVNIRSFSEKTMKGNKLVYNKGINDIDEILDTIKENSLNNKYSIVNENIDINDCGVSGVALGDVIEFSPEDTPKCVEKEGVCSLPREIGLRILQNVYGFSPDIKFYNNYRIEFSIHPNRQGVKKQHTIIWEYEYYEKVDYQRKISWPNNFSRFIGDKVFGLLIADSLGIMVPKTTVISRKIAPFTFGIDTGLNEKWIRTCPIKKEPGKFFTGSNWIDPFKLMEEEEAKGSNEINIASIISQHAVDALYSGASFVTEYEDGDLIEGVFGNGDKFMVGEQDKLELPIEVIERVKTLNNKIRSYHKELGNVSVEWVYDGKTVWLVQLNQLKGENKYKNLDSNIIVHGNPAHYEKVFVKDGLDSLRNKIELFKDKNIGVELIGNIGVTSHFGDLLRLSNIPSILKSED
ncbi:MULTISPECIES: hypothetical protein [Clostridium]|nr:MULTISPECIES: hypothetical protein [Clostridium]MDB2155504.1 hypothetical protein [Clostridium butyricum]MDU1114747.1 hypothetical protein [Clostridium sp.]MDU7711858.1 hypothetical protein [Clostridium butyricum]